MYNETTRLVKVVMPVETEEDILQGETNPILASVNPTRALEPSNDTPEGGEVSIMLSDTAENLYIAYEVVAMVKDEETGKTHFSQLKWKKLGTVEDESESEAESESESEETEPQLVYEFMFESGDKFVAYAADEYPALDGDELQMLSDSSSGGGSGGSTGGVVTVHVNDVTGALDKTWQEIHDADFAVLKITDGTSVLFANVSAADTYEGEYIAVFLHTEDTGDGVRTIAYVGVTDSPDGYPALQESGGGGGGSQS